MKELDEHSENKKENVDFNERLNSLHKNVVQPFVKKRIGAYLQQGYYVTCAISNYKDAVGIQKISIDMSNNDTKKPLIQILIENDQKGELVFKAIFPDGSEVINLKFIDIKEEKLEGLISNITQRIKA